MMAIYEFLGVGLGGYGAYLQATAEKTIELPPVSQFIWSFVFLAVITGTAIAAVWSNWPIP